MRAVVQRVLEARVEVDGKVVGEVGRGLLVYVAFSRDDGSEQMEKMAKKIVSLRLFPDLYLDTVTGCRDVKSDINASVADVGGEVLIISQFTLYGDCSKGNRPSFSEAMAPDKARVMYEDFVDCLRGYGVHVESGVFGAYMQVSSVNDGPVTLIVDR